VEKRPYEELPNMNIIDIMVNNQEDTRKNNSTVYFWIPHYINHINF